MTARPRVSIVIPAFNEQATIRNCLSAAVGQLEPAHEILVVDNLSTDGTVDEVESVIAEFPTSGIRLMRQTGAQGLVPTRNLGLDAATGDILGRIDADSVLAPTWVQQTRRAFVVGGLAAASGPVEYYDMPWRSWGHRADDAMRRIQVRLAGEWVFLFGSNMAITRGAWHAIRDDVCPDHEDLMHEDLDLAVHLALRGHRIGYVSAMKAGMSARRLDDAPADFRFYVDRFARTYAAHGIRDVRLLAPMVVFRSLYPALHVERKLRARRAERRAAPIATAD